MKFKYKAISKDGTTVSGKLTASDEEDAFFLLNKMGLTILSVKRTIDWGYEDNNFSKREAINFLKELLTILRSGLSPLEAVEYMGTVSNDNPKFRRISYYAYKIMRDGSSFVEGLEKSGFPKEYLNVVSIGEKTGNLEKGIAIEIEQIELKIEIGKRLSGIYIAPAVSGFFMLLSTIAVIIWLAPMQKKIIYSLLDDPNDLDSVPPISRMAFLVADYGIQAIVGFILFLVVFFLLKSITRKIFYKVDLFFDRIAMSMPVFGIFYRNVEYFKIANILQLSMGSGGHQSEVMNVVKDKTSSPIIKAQLNRAYELVRDQGLLLSRALEEVGFNRLLALTVRRGEIMDKIEAVELLKDISIEYKNKSLYNMSILEGASEMINMVMLTILSIPVLLITVAPSIDQVTLMMNKM